MTGRTPCHAGGAKRAGARHGETNLNLEKVVVRSQNVADDADLYCDRNGSLGMEWAAEVSKDLHRTQMTAEAMNEPNSQCRELADCGRTTLSQSYTGKL